MRPRRLFAIPAMAIGSCHEHGPVCGHFAQPGGCLGHRIGDVPQWRLQACLRSTDDMATLRTLVSKGRLSVPLERVSDHQVIEHVWQMLERGQLCLAPAKEPDAQALSAGGAAPGQAALFAAENPQTLAPATALRAPAGASAITARNPPSARPPSGARTQHWIAIELVDEAGSPVANEAYRVVSPSGRLIEGRLDQRGSARIDDIESAGLCRVSFPRLDGAAWELAAR
jgi:hypothetical protein